MGLGPYLVTSALGCVVAQRLVRRLCKRCKSRDTATSEELLELEAMSLVADHTTPTLLSRAVGCEQCRRTGYRGRMAIHEVMVMMSYERSFFSGRRPNPWAGPPSSAECGRCKWTPSSRPKREKRPATS